MNNIVRILAAARYKIRSDTFENWNTENPILLSGEPSVVLDGKDGDWLKIGDGVTPWNELPYKKGPKGEPFRYEDFTVEQLENLRGPKGDKGDRGEQGIQGEQGKDAVTDQAYNSLSPNAQSGVAVAQAVSGQEKTFNKVSVIEKEYIDNNTYPSTEAVYNFVGATVKTGTDVEPVPLYSLATGIYIINGPYQLKMGMSGYREGYGSLVYVYEYAAEIDRVSYTLLVIIDRERITRYYVNTHDFIWIDTVSIEELCDAQVLSNKTTVINSDSTDTEYPSAKAVHTALTEVVGDIKAALAELVDITEGS